MEKMKLGEILLKAGVVDELQLRSALAYQQKWGGKLGKNLLELGFVTEEQLLKALSNQLKLPAVDLKRFRIPPGVLKVIPYETAKKLSVIPLGIKEDGGKKFLYLAMSDPTDTEAISQIEFISKLPVRPVISTESAIQRAIKYYYEGDSEAFQDFKTQVVFTERDRVITEKLMEQNNDLMKKYPLEKIVNAIFNLLIKKKIITEDELKELLK
jgi:type IV pilus assembly protein PilB